MNSVILAVSDQQVENLFDKAINFAFTAGGAFFNALSDVPNSILGWGLVILVVIVLWKKVSS